MRKAIQALVIIAAAFVVTGCYCYYPYAYPYAYYGPPAYYAAAPPVAYPYYYPHPYYNYYYRPAAPYYHPYGYPRPYYHYYPPVAHPAAPYYHPYGPWARSTSPAPTKEAWQFRNAANTSRSGDGQTR